MTIDRKTAFALPEWRTLKVHPVAAIFLPITGDEWMILSRTSKRTAGGTVRARQGRNANRRPQPFEGLRRRGSRAEVCSYNDDDIDGFIFAANCIRRDLSQGQRALIDEQARRLKIAQKDTFLYQTQAAQQSNIPQSRFSEAALILDYAHAFVESVRDGKISFSAALKQARENKLEKEARDAKVAQLNVEAPGGSGFSCTSRGILCAPLAGAPFLILLDRRGARRYSTLFRRKFPLCFNFHHREL